MLKLLFWSLLCANGLLFAYGQGYLGEIKGSAREPARLSRQLHPDKLRLITQEQALAAVPAPAAPAPPPENIACLEIGDFGAADGQRFAALLAPLALGRHQSRQDVPVQEITSHIVYIPPQGSREAAERKAGELKNLGVSNYFIMSDSTTMKWAISLGVFKSEAAAQTLLAALNKQGVHSARIMGRGASSNKVLYQFRDIDVQTKAKLAAMQADFSGQQMRGCK